MSPEFLDARRTGALTRISVTGSRNFYIVRNGDQLPVRVWRGTEGLQCECGRESCEHLLSLQLCGFVEAPWETSRAA